MVLLLDLLIITVTFIFTWQIYYLFKDQPFEYQRVFSLLLLGIPAALLAAQLFKPHHGILRHTAMHDVEAVLKTQALNSASFFIASLTLSHFTPILRVHWAVVLTHFVFATLSLLAFRFFVRYFYIYIHEVDNCRNKKKVMIFGAGELGIITNDSINSDRRLSMLAVGFIDDNPMMRGKILGGTRVYSQEDAFLKIIPKMQVEEIILAISPSKISRQRKAELVDECLKRNIRITEIPAPWQWINGSFNLNQLNTIKIEDLLGRDAIRLENQEVKEGIFNRRIMVTGAAGSIGSEIVRQLGRLRPAELILVDIAESAVYDLYNDLRAEGINVPVNQVIADVSDAVRMRRVFERYRPELIYHASAYKHVPMMEEQPYEAVKTNIRGTRVVADLAVEFGAGRFVMVSTDKAVNPTNVMGASKRICEIYTQSLSQRPGVKTQFITTRFGNVLGSNGSVIPLFRKQIARGGPLTITHRDITRFFMTIPEASQLVLEAGFMGKGGEIFVFDMGKSVKIYDLAVKMISLAGFRPHEDIAIIETGLRPGEKLYEEVLSEAEPTVTTHNEKILIARIREKDYDQARRAVVRLTEEFTGLTDLQIVQRMKEIVPVFISNNSVYEKLDRSKEEKKYNPVPVFSEALMQKKEE
jgi:FlaA1/EpsC-like NDP-sugar epimerase